jgi:hypothetical protein
MADQVSKETITLRHMLPVISASTLGTAIEWYDFFLYIFFSATVFSKLFPHTRSLHRNHCSFHDKFRRISCTLGRRSILWPVRGPCGAKIIASSPNATPKSLQDEPSLVLFQRRLI